MVSGKTILALACASVLWGCSKNDSEVDSASPESYMKDKAFMKQLEDQRQKRDGLLVERMKIAEKLEAEKAKDPNSDQVKNLQKELDARDAEFDNNRKATYKIVRERLMKKDGGNK